MGDPLSIAASVAGLVSLGIQACQGLTSYYQAYTDRPENVAKTIRSLESLCGSLQNLETTLSKRRFHPENEQVVKQSLRLNGVLPQGNR
jgi:Fungal N-terminal domain of STAND proteins